VNRTSIHAEALVGDALTVLLGAPFAHGERLAIIDNGVPITYRELDERIRVELGRIADTRSGGAGSSDPVGVLASRDTDTMVSMLAALRAGAPYCPIDAALPATRKRALMSHVGLNELLSADPAGSEHTVGVPVEGRTIDPQRAETGAHDRRRPPRGEDPAYVLFTSGSTGSPKPVAIPRRALAAAVPELRSLFGLTPRDRVLQFAAPSWDTALEEMLPAVAAGAAVVFDEDAYQGAFPQFLRAVARQRITVLNLSTAWWHELTLYLREEDSFLPACVRLVVIGGEPVNPGRLRAWCELQTGHALLLNTYGCTETTMITHAMQLTRPGVQWKVPESANTVPLGTALPHVSDHLTNAGELLVSGDNLALGYLGLPEQTAGSFRTADHGTGPARWFHTGDLMKRDEGGLLYPVGRTDGQLKVRGVRVHPTEVEAVLSTHPEVAASAVCGEEISGQTSLTAYVVLSGTVSVAELRRYVRERLPNHFVPHRVHSVPALCFTSTGKIDRAATRRRFAMAGPGAGE
jgi:amino acid adenylation domain-containing protein